ncbi:hypothetical protein [Allomesorhizobium camelthorni]|uniref:Uncharacterized protein n=1 Tax=Allomesorhizobium camelthorni TaxID=475069 RepID=A0A6G4WKB4_9HYPH|nr:hypothetical protein [Mesorhizobium camelthorni]NGO54527.1 hypothetical protein [Mesorhizobium camelthorni]
MSQPYDFLGMQQAQFRHDQRNHSDVICLPKPDRLKHYGLHFAKYVGRLARGNSEPKSADRTLVDMTLVCLSVANALHQRIQEDIERCSPDHNDQVDPLRSLADAAGRFADACEKIDHLEDFLPIARLANADVLSWTLRQAMERGLDLNQAIAERRKELVVRQFYIAD